MWNSCSGGSGGEVTYLGVNLMNFLFFVVSSVIFWGGIWDSRGGGIPPEDS